MPPGPGEAALAPAFSPLYQQIKSLLLNGFDTPMETLPVIERELGLTPLPANAASPAAR